MSRYAIWNKQDDIYTPSGAKFTAAEWIDKYPIAGIEDMKIVCGGGVLNGSVFGVFDEMVQMYMSQGCDFTGCTTDQNYLDTIEAFEDKRNKPPEGPTPEKIQATSLASIAASMEYQNLMTLPDAENTDTPGSTDPSKDIELA